MKLAYPLTTEEKPNLAQVGGKAMSLTLMTQHGLPVPLGFVLSVAFFEPWLERIQKTPEWAQALDSGPENIKHNCDALIALCIDLELDETHKEALSKALAALKSGGKMPLLAVRSSSPEEDLEGASFAGGYETMLGVKKEGLEDAVRRSFASCLDERVFVYKREHGFAIDMPNIAVVVQQPQQVRLGRPGAADSVHPLGTTSKATRCRRSHSSYFF